MSQCLLTGAAHRQEELENRQRQQMIDSYNQSQQGGGAGTGQYVTAAVVVVNPGGPQPNILNARSGPIYNADGTMAKAT